MDRGTLTGGPPYTGISGTPAKEEDYTLDAVGNWAGYVKKTAGSTELNQTRTHNGVNEITGITPANPWINPTYDDAGNMITAPKPGAEGTRIHMKYDAWNRMVEVRNDSGGSPGTLIITCRYDGLTRRIQKIVAGSPDVTYDYYYSGYQVVETRKGGDTDPLEQYVWDIRYVHSPACRFRDSDGNDSLDETLYYSNDANFNVTALIEPDGDVVERVVYDPYGKPTFYDGSWANPSATSAYANDVLYTGHRLDVETGLIYGGFRYYHPTMGRWTTWDPIGYKVAMSLYESVLGNPCNIRDPYGLEPNRADAIGFDQVLEDVKTFETGLEGSMGKWLYQKLRCCAPCYVLDMAVAAVHSNASAFGTTTYSPPTTPGGSPTIKGGSPGSPLNTGLGWRYFYTSSKRLFQNP